jgi:NAD(P)-dependent dehydrogenase (short-subunit alcohol dehydrogenase family)
MTDSLLDQTVVILGGSAGIGLATARVATAEGTSVVLTDRDHRRLEEAAREVGAAGHAAFDAIDSDRLREFFWTLAARTAIPRGRPAGGHDRSAGWRRALYRRHPAGGARPSGLAWCRCSAWDAGADQESGARARSRPGQPHRPGFVDMPLPASLLGDGLDARREQLREILPIKRVVGLEDVAALAVHLMVNTALTGATFDVDGGQQII